MIDPYFPVDLGVLNAHLRFVTLQDGGLAHLGETVVRAAELNHPGGALGFRLEHGGRSMVYATDFEHGTALVYVGLTAQQVALRRTYRHLSGITDRLVNNGTAVDRVTIPAQDGVILLDISR